MKELRCRICGKTLGYVKDDYAIDDEDCLCEEHYKKAIDEKVEFTIVQRPFEIQLVCPFCAEEVRIPWDEVPNSNGYWGDIHNEEVECPHCHEYITLGDYDVD